MRIAIFWGSMSDVGRENFDDALDEDIAPPPSERDLIPEDDSPLAGPDAPDDDQEDRS